MFPLVSSVVLLPMTSTNSSLADALSFIACVFAGVGINISFKLFIKNFILWK